MTHDELLTQLEGLWHDSYKAPGYQALRSVVELHKPGGYEYFEKDICEHCTLDIDYYIFYPCPTIEIIEKELL